MSDAVVSAPILARLEDARTVLLAGAGGGYDVMGCVPIALELATVGKQVHLASWGFLRLNRVLERRGEAPTSGPVRVTSADAQEDEYTPEPWLARWLAENTELEPAVWCLPQSGVKSVKTCYEQLTGALDIDAIVLVDGGIDLILRGDESSIGTPAEDLTSLAAVRSLDVPTKLIACVGLGAELRDGIPHEQVFARIAELTALGGFLGPAGLRGHIECAGRYEEAVQYVFGHQQDVKRSHVHSVITRAMDGEFGAVAEHVWLSPLLPLMWYFDLDAVADTHLFLDELQWTETLLDVVRYIEGLRRGVDIRPKTSIPI